MSAASPSVERSQGASSAAAHSKTDSWASALWQSGAVGLYRVTATDDNAQFLMVEANAAIAQSGLFLKPDCAGQPLSQVLPRQQYQQHQHYYRQCVDTQTPMSFTAPAKTGWWQLNLCPLPVSDAAAPQVLVTAMDITPYQQAIARSQTAERTLQQIIDYIPSLIVWKDRHSIYKGCNQSFLKITGLSSIADVVGKDDYDMPWKKKEADWFRACDQRIMVADEPEFNIIEPIRQADGTEAWLSTSKIPLHDTEGSVDGILVVIEDITEKRKLEIELAQQEAQYRSIFENAADGLVISDLETGRAVAVNPALCELYGYTAEEFIQLTPAQFISSESLPEFARFVDSLRSGQSFQADVVGLSKQNQRIYLEVKAKTIEFEGKPHSLSVLRDVSAQRQAVQALQHSEEKFRKIVETVNDLLYIHDTSGTLHYLSPRIIDVLGYTPDELLGQPFVQLIHPEDLPIYLRAIQTAVETEQKIAGIEFRAQQKCGNWITLSANIAPAEDETGAVTLLIGSVRDVTADKVAAEQLKDYADRQRLLNQLTNQIRQSLEVKTIVETTINNLQQIMELDGCLFAWLDETVQPNTWQVVLDTASHPEDSRVGCYACEDVGPIAQALRADGTIVIEDIESYPEPVHRQLLQQQGVKSEVKVAVQTADGRLGMIVGNTKRMLRTWQPSEMSLLRSVADQLAIAIDQAQLYETSQQQAQQLTAALTQLQNTQTHMVQAEKMSSLGQMVAGIAHEINNPVNFIHGNLKPAKDYANDLLEVLEQYQKEYPQPSESLTELIEEIDLDFTRTDFLRLLDSMKVGTQRIREIVLSLRNFSRLDEADVKAVDLHEGINSTLVILAHKLKPSQGEVAIELLKQYGELPPVECYPSQLNQVIMNILANAIDALKHTASPKITITTYVQDDDAVIQIADNGPGIPAAVQQVIFDPFFTTKPVGQGTGMGLSISYQIVTEKHGGTLLVRSSPEQGTQFTIKIPLWQG